MSRAKQALSASIQSVQRLVRACSSRFLRRRAMVGLLLIIGSLCLSIVCLQGLSPVRAQVPVPAVPPPAQLPGPERQSRYQINFNNVSYFYFTENQGAVVYFPGNDPPLILKNDAESEQVRQFAQHPAGGGLPQKIGRYFVNLSKATYHELKDDGTVGLHFVSCPAINLTAREAAILDQLTSAPAGMIMPAPSFGAPPAQAAPGSVPPQVPGAVAPAPGDFPPPAPRAAAPSPLSLMPPAE